MDILQKLKFSLNYIYFENIKVAYSHLWPFIAKYGYCENKFLIHFLQ